VHVSRRATWRDIEADAETRTLAVPPGTVVDLGATAKAWAADCAAADIAARLGCGMLVNLGGDIAVAGPSPSRGWSVRIAGTPPDESGAVVSITSGGLATSSSGVRRWRRGGCVLHHIIDPRTSTSTATPWVTVSVAAASCLDANIASTTSVIRGAAALGWLGRLELPARLVDHSGNVQVLGGWPADGAP
jgi:FAD:protein FMN transferase